MPRRTVVTEAYRKKLIRMQLTPEQNETLTMLIAKKFNFYEALAAMKMEHLRDDI